MKKLKKFPAEFQRHKRAVRSRGHVTKQGRGLEGNREKAEGQRGSHLRDPWTGQLEGGEKARVEGRENRVRENQWRQGGEMKETD